jgi:hypothetical protein
MKLSDQEIIDLSALCDALVDGRITEKEKARLGSWLAESEEARKYYIRAMGLSASLFTYASETQLEAADALPRPSKVIYLARTWWIASLAAAASITLLVWNFARSGAGDKPVNARDGEPVARLTASRGCRWTGDSAPAQPDAYLRPGQQLDLASGLAEITFDSGARVILVGPASLKISSAWDAALRRGTIKASVPPEAIGFRISNPAVEVVDLGTEFTMTADAKGGAEVLVLKGEVEAEPGADADGQTIVLREKEARRFASTGISQVDDSEQKFAQWAKPMPLDRLIPTTDYVHWSFDETAGDVIRADNFGLPLTNYNARIGGEPMDGLAAAHTRGRWLGALKFDGQAFARAPLPGISSDQPHTVAFWVKVPTDAPLSDAYAMVAWGTKIRKLGLHPVHICWNRNPTEGTVGVLRTDYGGGFALGATPLRDGRWHHVAVVFVPGADPDVPVDLKQYVDGRFEGEGNPSPPGKRTGSGGTRGEVEMQVNDTVWLGCRLGSTGQRRDRFRGELDELCIADRALEPREIVELMKNNRPQQPVMAAQLK